MLDQYLRFSINYGGDSPHPCARHLFAVYQAFQLSIGARALALGVAVEGLVKELFPESETQDREKKQWVRELKTFCSTWTGFTSDEIKKALWDRLNGFLDTLSRFQPKDELYRLASQKVLSRRLVDDWRKLRPKAAHAGDWAPDETQQLVDLCNSVTTLVHHLVFKAIAYEGCYTDYSEHGFPLRRYRGRAVTEEEVAVAAYFHWKNNGSDAENDWHHWFTARQMLEQGRI